MEDRPGVGKISTMQRFLLPRRRICLCCSLASPTFGCTKSVARILGESVILIIKLVIYSCPQLEDVTLIVFLLCSFFPLYFFCQNENCTILKSLLARDARVMKAVCGLKIYFLIFFFFGCILISFKQGAFLYLYKNSNNC